MTDMTEAFDWYEGRQDGLGKKFMDEIEIFIDSILRNPMSFAPRGDQRIAFLKRFPFKIIFEIESRKIVVYRIFHARRNPGQLHDIT